ncbi:MAG TPA: proton-conducting transporter membrane subunit [Candidatus Eisenbacteria bacterium]|nr:proton-conducting transporter membrane subunit [Candidatus Eisenbacteria bacterium]
MRTVTLLPEVVVAAAALALLLGARLLPARRRLWLRLGALGAAVVALGLELWLGAALGTLFAGGWQQDRFALFAKAALLLGLIVLVAGDLEAGDPEAGGSALPLAFLVAFGGMVAASATSLVGLWAGLELAALAAVAAAGVTTREIGTRLLLVSAVAGALVAVGFAALYAMAGGASLAALTTALRPATAGIPLAFVVLLTLTGVVVRLGLAPFQIATVEGGLAVGPVGAGALGGLLTGVAAVVAARLLSGLDAVNLAGAPWLSTLAALAMVLGGLRAATASSARGVVAWLVVAQVGWLAAGLALHDLRGSAGALLVLGALLLAAAAAPALAADEDGDVQLAGLRRAQPARAAALAVLLLSLAGVPPLAGFVGQFAVAAELIRSGLAWVLAVGLLGSLLALYGVVRVIRQMYLEAGPEPQRGRARGRPAWSPIPLAPAVLVLLYSVLANPISGLAQQGAAALRLP